MPLQQIVDLHTQALAEVIQAVDNQEAVAHTVVQGVAAQGVAAQEVAVHIVAQAEAHLQVVRLQEVHLEVRHQEVVLVHLEVEDNFKILHYEKNIFFN